MIKNQVLKLQKKVGETPLECLERFRKSHPQYKNDKMTYAGRLDPLASGRLLVLTGEECKNKEKYLKLDKEYEVDVLFGFATDSYDVLGLITEYVDNNKAIAYLLSTGDLGKIRKIVRSFEKKFKQPYPPYSTRLWEKARSGELKVDEIPEKIVQIYKIKILSQKNISKKVLEKYINKSVNLVRGDFRQKKILKKWQAVLLKTNVLNFPTISLRVKCSSGTYMRSLAYNIGKKVGIPALALRIKRTKILGFTNS